MSWQELNTILRDRAAAVPPLQSPTACPNDGEPLQRGHGAILFCLFDGWQWPRDVPLTERTQGL